ncbi:MAG TPA: hypothetical protein VMX11_08810 [Actinomycetes bacterium]|nr:hypothetical protein [Actinomycetes bacterium]
MTRAIPPLALTAPVAALAVVAATGWAISADDQPAAAVPLPATSAAPATTKDPALRALTKAVAAERADVRHLEKAVKHARERLQTARKNAVVVAAASPVYSGTTGSSGTWSSTSGTSGGSASGGSSGGSGGGAAPKPAPKPAPAPAPTANTSTGGS